MIEESLINPCLVLTRITPGHPHVSTGVFLVCIDLALTKCYTSRNEYTASPDSDLIHGTTHVLHNSRKERMDVERKIKGGGAVQHS